MADIVEAGEKIARYTRGMSVDAFQSDEKTIDAVVRNLEVIGEAAKHLPSDVRREAPDVDWKRIAGLRDILIHEYFGVDLDIVWDVIVNKVPALVEQVRPLLRTAQ